MLYIQRYRSPLGEILMAADDAGLVGLWFAGQKHFAPGLTQAREQETPVLAAAGRWLDLYFAGRRPHFTPPLHLTGTEFRMAVWSLLQDPLWRNDHLRGTGPAAGSAAGAAPYVRPGGGRRGGTQPHFPDRALPPGDRRRRQPHRLCRRGGQKAPSAGLGGAGRVPICLTIRASRSVSRSGKTSCCIRGRIVLQCRKMMYGIFGTF